MLQGSWLAQVERKNQKEQTDNTRDISWQRSSEQYRTMITEELIDLVHYTVTEICKQKGYLVTPKVSDVKLTLEALWLVNRIQELKENL